MANKVIAIKPTSILGVPTGGQVGANADLGGGVSAGASVGATPIPTARIGANYQSGDLNVGAGLTPGGPQVSATIGKGTGAQIGGLLGTTMPGGSLLGSAIGNATDSLFGSKYAKAHAQRQGLLDAYGNAGVIGKDGTVNNPDGSTVQIKGDGSQTHSWKDPSKAQDRQDGQLFQFDTDYTNDMDYVAGMGGITLSRLLTGKTGKDVDQAGSALGNASLGSVGYGADFNQNNFNTVATNLRARYAAAGINSKADLLALANKQLADGRIKDTDFAAMKQTGDMVFDKNYGLASQLMAGRWDGIKSAATTPADSHSTVQPSDSKSTQPSDVYRGGALTHEEAMLSSEPIRQYRLAHQMQQGGGSGTASNWASAITALTAGLGIYNTARKGWGTDKGIGGLASDVYHAVVGNTPSGGYDPNWMPSSGSDLPDVSNISDVSDIGGTATVSPGDFTLPDAGNLSDVSDIGSNASDFASSVLSF